MSLIKMFANSAGDIIAFSPNGISAEIRQNAIVVANLKSGEDFTLVRAENGMIHCNGIPLQEALDHHVQNNWNEVISTAEAVIQLEEKGNPS